MGKKPVLIKFVLVVFLFMVFLSGCTAEEKSLPYLGGDEDFQDHDFAGEEQFLLGSDNTTMVMSDPAETIDIVLYFSDEDGDLVAEQKQIPKVEGLAKATINELINGPVAEGGLYATVPLGTVLQDINIKDGLATVDFSSDIKTEHWGGFLGETLTVYSIVNTLTQFPTVDEVQILVDGQKQETLAGHANIFDPLTRNPNLVKAASTEE